MKNLKNNKASGEDLIANEYLKHSFEVMSDIYVKLFNLIFDKGLIPEQWLYYIYFQEQRWQVWPEEL